MKKFFVLSLILSNFIYADCSDLDFNDCIYWSAYCEWNDEASVCQDIGDNEGGENSDYIEPSCIPFEQTDPIPYNTTEYANMCMEYVGIPPTVDCGDGIYIPIYVNGEEVFEDQPDGSCDDPDFKGTCKIGSRVGRVEGIDIDGNPIPDVVWVYFCRSAGQDLFEQMGVVSVQMIGYNMENGATCFFESPDAVGDNIQSEYLFYDLNACNKYFVEEADLRNIETYCLIISGKYDIMTPAKSGYKLRTLLKSTTIDDRLEIISTINDHIFFKCYDLNTNYFQ